MPFKLKLKKSRHYSVVSKSLFVLTVELLDGTSIECTLSSESTGQECLDVVCQKLGLNQPKFFGLQYMGRLSREAGNSLTWLELDRPIKRQLDKHARGLCVFVRVMYYILSGVKLLNDEVTRNHYFLQLKMDIIDGRITCTPQQAIDLASYCMQAEFGNFDVERHTAHYLKDFQLFPKDFTDPTFLENLTEAASRQHALLHNTPQSIAEEKYICACQKLNGYGQERYNVKERNGEEVCIKVAVNGIKISYAIKEDKIYEWTDISNVINHKKEFTIESVHGHDKADFQFSDAETAKNAWRFCILQHMFYRQFEAANVATEASNPNVRLTQSMGNIEQSAPVNSQQSSSRTSTIAPQQQIRNASKLRAVGVGSYDDIHLHTLATSNGHALAPLYPQSPNNFQAQHMSQQLQQQAAYLYDLHSTTNAPSMAQVPHPPLTQQQRAQSTSCLDLNTPNPMPAHLQHHHHPVTHQTVVNSTSTPDLDRLRSLLPSYRPAPDYETALVQQQQQQHHPQQRYRGLVGVLQGDLQQQGLHQGVQRGYLYSSQPEIHSGYITTGGGGAVGQQQQQQVCYPDVTHNNVERKVLYSGVPGGGLYAQSQILVADHQRNMVDLVENIRLMHLNNNNQSKPPPPPYAINTRISSNSTPDLAGTTHYQQQHFSTKPAQLYNNSVTAAASSGSSPDLVSVGGAYNHQKYQQQQQPVYVGLHGGVHRSQSYLPPSGTYENLASIFAGNGNGNMNNGSTNNGANSANAGTTAAVIVENPNITKHIRKVYDEHGNIIYCMPANMKQILEDNQIHGATPFVVRRSAQTLVPTAIAAERHKSNTEPIYENIPFPPYEQQHQMRARTQSVQSAPPEIVIGSTGEGLYANIKDVEQQIQQQSQQISAHQLQQQQHQQQQHVQQVGATTIISIGGRPQGIITDNNIETNTSVNNKGNGNQQASVTSNTTNPSPSYFDTQSTTGSDTMSRTNTFIVNRSANASVKSSSGTSTSTPQSTSTPDRNTPTPNNSNRSAYMLTQSIGGLSNSVSSVTKLNTTSTSIASSFDANSTATHSSAQAPLSMSDLSSTSNTNSTNASTSSGGKKKKHRWGAILLGRGRSSSSDNEEKVKSATLGREKERTKGGGGGSGGSSDRQHRWSTGLSKLHHPLPPSISKETMCQLLENKLLDNQLYFEFEKIPKRKANAECNTATLTENALFNKYPDLVPYEDNRLRLTPTKENKSGYINASHITATVGSKQRFYIAAQGPTRQTLPYFWQCVWESEVYLIVQLTDLNNDIQYLPDAKERCINVGKEYQVWWEFSQKTGHCITSKVRLCHVTSRRYRTLWHLHYTDWGEPKATPTNGNAGISDKDCPQSVAHALGFLEELQSVQQHSMTEIPPGHNKNPPVLVHCPTAVGRTGLVILCDLLLYTVDHNQEVDIPTVVGLLRHQRAFMVQTLAQYRFVYCLLIHYLKQTRLI